MENRARTFYEWSLSIKFTV